MANEHVGVQRTTQSNVGRIANGVITLAAVILAFLAFDDITTDNATSFTFEYSILVACAIWCLVLAVRLARTRYFVLAGASVLVLAAGAWGQNSVGPGTVPSWHPGYVATVASLGWFLVLSIGLIVSSFAALPSRRVRRDGHTLL